MFISMQIDVPGVDAAAAVGAVIETIVAVTIAPLVNFLRDRGVWVNDCHGSP